MLALFIGCSSSLKNHKSSKKLLFDDPEIAAFMQDEAFEKGDSIQALTDAQIHPQRPPWAKLSSSFIEDKDLISRIGYDAIGDRDINIVRDSLKQDLRDLLSGDVETRVERTIVDSLSSHIVGVGKNREVIRNHMMTIVSRHYSPPLIFNGNYDTNEYWTDDQEKTLWLRITFNKKRYIIDQRVKILAELEKVKIEAYKYLGKAFKSLSFEGDVEASLSNLGVASYYISKGGGEAEVPDIINPGTNTRISFQRKELIKEIDKAIQLEFVNVLHNVTISRDYVAQIKLKCRNPKNYDLSRVKIKISSKGNTLEHPGTIKLDARGMAEFSIAINPRAVDPYNQDININISFDIFSESLLPDKEWKNWVLTDDYFELLEELPTIGLPIHTVEFQARKTWVILNERNPYSNEIGHDKLQSELERSIGKHSKHFLLVQKENWPIGYKKYQQYKSGSKRYDELGNDKYDVEKHDLDVFLRIDKTVINQYDMHLEIGSAKRNQGGIISSSILGIPGNAVKASIDKLVEKLLDEYFYRELIVVAPDKHKISTFINADRVEPTSSENNQFIYNKIPRFLSQDVTVMRPKFRPQSIHLMGESFSTNIVPPVQEKFDLDVFTPLIGTLKINVKDAVTQKVISFGGKGLGKAPRITIRRRLFFLPSPIKYKYSDDTSIATFSIESVGKYYISVEKDFYTVPLLPHLIRHEVVDDFNPRSSELNNIDISLKKSDPKYARRMSIILPGSGQYYLNKQRQALGFFSAAALSSLATIFSYIQYSNEVAHYNELKEEYLDSEEADWYALESKLSKSETRLNKLRPQFYASLITGSMVWTLNVVTVTW
jgi:hypothetical protein